MGASSDLGQPFSFETNLYNKTKLIIFPISTTIWFSPISSLIRIDGGNIEGKYNS